MKYTILSSLLIFNLAFILISCAGQDESAEFNSNYLENETNGRYLYVVSGACYGGGVTTSTGAATVSRFNKSTGAFERVLVDYNSMGAGDNPVGIVDNGDSLLVLVENTGGRRIDVIDKDTFDVNTYLTNTTALSAVVRALVKLTDGSLLVSKSSAVEKFNAAKARVTMGASPYINAPAGSCATSTTLISSATTLSNGKIVYAHAAATPNNKFAIISATGYSAAGDCLAGQAGPTTTALPTGVLMHSSGKLIVTYGSTTAASNLAYAYDLNITTNAISGATSAYSDFGNLYGPSAIAEDPETTDVFIANALSTFNTIERFSFDSTSKTLTKLGTSPFIRASIYTRCVSGMVVGD